MSLLKFFAPDSQETDEEFVNRCLDNLNNPKLVRDALIDIVPFARKYSSIIGLKSSTILAKLLSDFSKDNEAVQNILQILNELVLDDSLDSNSNSGYIVDEETALPNIFECLNNKSAKIRGLSLSLIKNLLRLQPSKVQSFFFETARAQKSLCNLIDDPVDMIRSNFMYLIPSLVQGNNDIQQMMAFSLMDPLAERISTLPSAEVIPALQSLLDGNSKVQKLFVETGHLTKLLPLIKSRDDRAISLLTMLFQSTDAASFRPFILDSGLIPPLINGIMNHSTNSKTLLKLLGYIIRGSTELCLSISNELEKIITLTITTKDNEEQNCGLFFIECYCIKGSKSVSEALCNHNSLSNILQNFNEMITENYAIYNIACSCLITNNETKNIFYVNNLNNDKSFFMYSIETLSKITNNNSIVLPVILKFISAIIWESSTATKLFISTISSLQRKDKQSTIIFLISLCIDETKEPLLKSITSLILLESLLFKTNDEVFIQLIELIKARIGISVLITSINNYVDSLEEQSIWYDFVQDVVRVVRKNRENLLDIKSEIQNDSTFQAQILNLTEKNDELTKQNIELNKKIEENKVTIESLEQQIEEIQTVIPTYEKCLNDQQQTIAQTNEEKELLNQEIEKLKSKLYNTNNILLGNDDDDLQVKYNDLLKQFNETKENLLNQIKNLKEENQQLKDKLLSSNVTNQLVKENDDLRQQIDKAKKHIKDLEQVDQELQNSKKEIEKLLKDKIELEQKLNNSNQSNDNEKVSDLLLQIQNNKKVIENLQNELSNKNKNNSTNELIEKELNEIKIRNQEKELDLNNEINKLKQELNEIKKSKEFDSENFTNELTRIQQMNTETENELVNAMDENEKLINKLKSKKEKIQKLKCNIKNISSNENTFNENETLNKLKEQLIEYQLQNKNYIKENETLNFEVNKTQKEIKDLIDQNKKLNSEIKNFDEEKEKIIKEKNEQIIKLQEISENQQNNIEKLTKMIDNSNNELQKSKNLIHELQQNDNKKEDLNNQINSSKDLIKKLELKINEQKEEIKNLQNKVSNDNKNEKISKLEAQIKQQNKEIEIQKELLNKTKQKNQKLKTEILNLQVNSNKDNDFDKIIKEKDNQINKLEQKCQKLKAKTLNILSVEANSNKDNNKSEIQMKSIKTDNGIKSNLIILEQQIAKIKGSINNINSLNDAELVELISTQINSILSEFSSTKQEMNEIKSKYNKNKEVSRELKQNVNKVIVNMSQLKEKLNLSDKRNKELREKLKEMNQKFDESERNQAELREKHQSALRLIGELWTKNQTLTRNAKK